jgi:hypothetical protein
MQAAGNAVNTGVERMSCNTGCSEGNSGGRSARRVTAQRIGREQAGTNIPVPTTMNGSAPYARFQVCGRSSGYQCRKGQPGSRKDEVEALDPTGRSELKRADGVAQRIVVGPEGARGQEDRKENGPATMPQTSKGIRQPDWSRERFKRPHG